MIATDNCTGRKASMERLLLKSPAALYLIAALAFIKNPFSLLDFPLDDAWIHQVYARAFAFGHGFAYNPGQQEAGSTSPLWTVVTAPAHWLDGLGYEAATLAVKAIGLLLGLVCVLLVQRIAAGVSRSRAAGAWAALLFALDPRLLFSAYSGMETCLLVALLLAAGLMLLSGRPLLFVLFLGLTPVTRPEALLLMPLAALVLWVEGGRELRLGQKGAALLLWAVPTLLWVGFCLLTTGHLFPNTYYLKAKPFALNVDKLRVGVTALVQYGTLAPWLFGVGLLGFCGLCRQRGRAVWPVSGLFLYSSAVLLVGVLGSRTMKLEGYYWTRWTDPSALLLAACSALGLVFLVRWGVLRLRNAAASASSGRRAVKAAALLAGAAVFSLAAAAYADTFAGRRSRFASDSRAISIVNVMMGKWVAQNTPADAVVGTIDAGAVRYFGNRQTVDLFGLNNQARAFKKMSFEEAVGRCDWLTIFPRLYDKRVAGDFEPCVSITIPQDEYTVCETDIMTLHVAFRRVRPYRGLAAAPEADGRQSP